MPWIVKFYQRRLALKSQNYVEVQMAAKFDEIDILYAWEIALRASEKPSFKPSHDTLYSLINK